MLIKPILTYNSAICELTRKGEEKLYSFHQNQLKHLICKTYLISLLILWLKWKLFGHVLRLNVQSPHKEILFYFEKNNVVYFHGWLQTSILYTLNMKRTINKIPLFPHKSLEDLQYIFELAQGTEFWRKLIKVIYKVAGDEKSH